MFRLTVQVYLALAAKLTTIQSEIKSCLTWHGYSIRYSSWREIRYTYVAKLVNPNEHFEQFSWWKAPISKPSTFNLLEIPFNMTNGTLPRFHDPCFITRIILTHGETKKASHNDKLDNDLMSLNRAAFLSFYFWLFCVLFVILIGHVLLKILGWERVLWKFMVILLWAAAVKFREASTKRSVFWLQK